MIYKFTYSYDLPKDARLGEPIVIKTVHANGLFYACKICYLDTISLHYKPTYAAKIEKLVPKVEDFNKLKEAYKKLDFHFETVEIFNEE